MFLVIYRPIQIIGNELYDIMKPMSLLEKFEFSLTTIDLSIFHDIDDPDMTEHIQRVGVTFYEKYGHRSSAASVAAVFFNPAQPHAII